MPTLIFDIEIPELVLSEASNFFSGGGELADVGVLCRVGWVTTNLCGEKMDMVFLAAFTILLVTLL